MSVMLDPDSLRQAQKRMVQSGDRVIVLICTVASKEEVEVADELLHLHAFFVLNAVSVVQESLYFQETLLVRDLILVLVVGWARLRRARRVAARSHGHAAGGGADRRSCLLNNCTLALVVPGIHLKNKTRVKSLSGYYNK